MNTEVLLVDTIWLLVTGTATLFLYTAFRRARWDLHAARGLPQQQRAVVMAANNVRHSFLNLLTALAIFIVAIVLCFVFPPTVSKAGHVVPRSYVVAGTLVAAQIVSIINVLLDKHARNSVLRYGR